MLKWKHVKKRVNEMAKQTKKKINWNSVGLVVATALVCAVLAGAVIYHILTLQNSYTHGLQDGYARAAKTIQAK